jgi:small-conductance mechanosensitive channel
MRSYLDYKVYPAFGIDEGLAYSINTLIGYALLGAGVLFALRAVGLDFRVLMVFAGAIGIGIGLGLQNLAANLISGFILIFGRTVRKGDWIEIGGTLGIVQEVSLRATRVKTRDNIEYLMPNSELTAGTIINYTLSDPEIRVHIPVGVAYSSDPREVVRILLRAAEENPHVSRTQEPKVWFVEYGDNSINFELLVWIDVRKMTRREISSQLYFEIFDALGKAGIEIPFPQRDLRLRSGFANGVVFQGGQE